MAAVLGGDEHVVAEIPQAGLVFGQLREGGPVGVHCGPLGYGLVGLGHGFGLVRAVMAVGRDQVGQLFDLHPGKVMDGA